MTITATDIMTPSVKAVPQSWTMQQLARFLTDHEITGSPVCDEDERIIGIVTLKDVAEFHWNQVSPENEQRLTDEDRKEIRRLRHFLFEGLAQMPVEVRDIMTPMVMAVDEHTAVRDVANTMMEKHLHRIFVQRDKDIIGIITTYDMLRIIASPDMIRRCLPDDA